MAVGSNSYSATATLTYGIYVQSNGSWSRVAGKSVSLYGNGYSSGGSKSLSTTDTVTITYSGNVDTFRVVLESVDEGTGGSITGASNCTWTSQTSSGSRSATPNGEKVISTMRPS